ncbi:MAG: phage portal protein, partial [Aristaeellaceae bacterium]
MLTVTEIKKFMESDAASEKKRQAAVGMRYYEADHDIRNYHIFFLNNDGKLQEDKTKSNIKISHP